MHIKAWRSEVATLSMQFGWSFPGIKIFTWSSCTALKLLSSWNILCYYYIDFWHMFDGNTSTTWSTWSGSISNKMRSHWILMHTIKRAAFFFLFFLDSSALRTCWRPLEKLGWFWHTNNFGVLDTIRSCLLYDANTIY